MLDINLFLKDFDAVEKNLTRRNSIDKGLLKELNRDISQLKVDKAELENHRAELNVKNKRFGELMRENADVTRLKTELTEEKAAIAKIEEIVRELETKVQNRLIMIPNMIADDLPDGKDDESNLVIKEVLEPTKFDFEVKSHDELAKDNGWINFSDGVKLATSRFSILANYGAKVERALVNFMLDFNTAKGYSEYSLPYMVNDTTLIGTGQLPKFKDDLYKIEGEELYLIPTSEVTLTNLHSNEVLPVESLPLKITSFSQCFRREAGSGGRDIKGIIRQHQFPKVEIVQVTTQEESNKALNDMVNHVSDMLLTLGIPHRLVLLCSGDIGFSANKTIDLEAWIPSQNKYREISSVSNTLDFQARRAMIRYKQDGKNKYAHTLNGSSLAVGRTLVAIMENFQDKDGNIAIPEVLKPYIK